MKRTLSAIAFAATLCIPAVSHAGLLEPLPAVAPIPADNTMTVEKIELGKMLFFDPRLSGSNWISCATCHNPVMAFTDRIPRALGHAMSEGPRNTPTVLNAAFIGVQFWDGRAATLEVQALGPIQADVEMNQPLEEAVTSIKQVPEYVRMFQTVFGGEDPVTAENLAKAIAAFERTMITPNSPFDRYMRGDEYAMSDDAKAGLEMFKAKGCVACHNGPALTNSNFHRIKVPGSTDLGRYNVTNEESDKYFFRTPTLRNVELTAPYFNNGSVGSLDEAVRIMGKEALGLDLTDEEARVLEAFLVSLTGEMPRFEYPQLPK